MARKGAQAGSLPAWLTSVGDASFARLLTWPFWRTMVIFFCAFSVIGHLVEWPYCWLGMTLFGSVDPTDEVLANPLKPFFVYGVGIVLCCILLEPFRAFLLKSFHRPLTALLVFYAAAVVIGMDFELVQGFLQNQPDPVTGEYPLWDVSDHPGNILGQAWIVNDILIGALITAVVWVVLPACWRLVGRLDSKAANIVCGVVAAATLALTVATY